jgi:arginyl-tRNA synthetase
MYAYSRCRGILNNVPNLTESLSSEIIIDSILYHKLLLDILKYYQVIDKYVTELAPHHLCNYLYQLSASLGKFYSNKNNKCIEQGKNGVVKIHHNRIKLVYLVTVIMKNIFDLLGFGYTEQI